MTQVNVKNETYTVTIDCAEAVKPEKADGNARNNIRYLLSQGNVYQKELAEEMGYSESTFSRVLNGSSNISMDLLIRIRNRFGISIEELLFTDMAENEKLQSSSADIPMRGEMNYEGIYQMYDIVRDAYEKGRIFLGSGVMIIKRKERENNIYDVCACFMRREEATSMLQELREECGGDLGLMQLMLKEMAGRAYLGELEIMQPGLVIRLKPDERDYVSMMFTRPNSLSRKYIGGLGAMLAFSHGQHPVPRQQRVALSVVPLDTDEEELFHLLSMDESVPDFGGLTQELSELMTNLYSGKMAVDEPYRKILIEKLIDVRFQELCEKSIFSVSEVYDEADQNMYHLIKHAMSRKQGGEA